MLGIFVILVQLKYKHRRVNGNLKALYKIWHNMYMISTLRQLSIYIQSYGIRSESSIVA